MGSAAAGLAGAAAGTALGGPVGGVIGAVVGAVAGGSFGSNFAEGANPTDPEAEFEYWRSKYRDEPYVEEGLTYEDDYAPAYRVGYEGHGRHRIGGKTFDEAEADLERDYVSHRGKSQLEWENARHAARAAWDRADGSPR